MQETTDRPEAVAAGTAKLVGTSKNGILNNVIALLDNKKTYDSMAKASNPYGEGKAAIRIVEALG